MSRFAKRPRGYRPVVLVTPHSALCSAVATQQPYWSIGSVRFGWSTQRVPWDLTGRRNAQARHTWYVVTCGAEGCPAELAIYHTRLHAALGLDDASSLPSVPA